ncbi:MAG TPA: hypothetical protein VJU61_18610, partial [Polyangiaceae bacterium]|nr:hypothetical protein [Polyangiaceae bacterium]
MIERNTPILPTFLAVAALFGCAFDSRSPSEIEREAQTDLENRGAAPGPGNAGSSSGTEQSNVSGMGGSSGSAGNGGAGSGVAAGAADCGDAELVPEQIQEDLTVGPGCVRMNRTLVFSGATLTILPGTTVLMQSAGYLNVLNDPGSNLVAVGTADQPILFTSANSDPLPGDWQCVRISSNASDSQLEHVTFEYGGQPCQVTGASDDTTLSIEAALRGIENVTV